MSTKLAGAGFVPSSLSAEGMDKCVIVKAEWNSHITDALAAGARATLAEAGLDDSSIVEITVPGTVELTFAAQRAIRMLRPSAVIVIGCVIRGDTPHFDYVCQSVTQGVTMLNAQGDTPVVFSGLTVENEQQALDRAGGLLGNKGAEGAATALAMASLNSSLVAAGK